MIDIVRPSLLSHPYYVLLSGVSGNAADSIVKGVSSKSRALSFCSSNDGDWLVKTRSQLANEYPNLAKQFVTKSEEIEQALLSSSPNKRKELFIETVEGLGEVSVKQWGRDLIYPGSQGTTAQRVEGENTFRRKLRTSKSGRSVSDRDLTIVLLYKFLSSEGYDLSTVSFSSGSNSLTIDKNEI